MNRMELDRFVSENGKEIKMTAAQEEALKRSLEKCPLEVLRGVTNGRL